MKLHYILALTLLISYQSSAQDDSTSVATEKSDNDNAAAPEYSIGKARKSEKLYHIKKAIDYPVILATGIGAIYTMTVIYNKDPTPSADILALDKNNVSAFDRSATNNHDLNMDRISYYPFYGVMPLPMILLFDKKIRKDAGTVGTLYLEAFAFEGILYTGTAFFVDRYRPDVYNTSLDMSYRASGNNRNSFFAGHVAVVATSTFFMAKVYNDYHPGSNLRWVFYGGAAAATIGMGYMRYAAGKHFPTDILTGAVLGTAIGLLVPAIHKNRDFKNQKWSLAPAVMDNGSTGFSFTYKL